MSEPVRILVLPIARRYWLWHAWSDPAQAAASSAALKPWREGVNLEERVQLMSEHFSNWAHAKIVKQWQGLENAKEGSIRNRLYKLAQAVLSREDPDETFLKSVPKETSAVEIIYPSSLESRLVRRRLRLMVKRCKWRHRSRMVRGRLHWLHFAQETLGCTSPRTVAQLSVAAWAPGARPLGSLPPCLLHASASGATLQRSACRQLASPHHTAFVWQPAAASPSGDGALWAPLAQVGWGVAVVPLVPLLATPIPNLPLYYAGWRLYSHMQALGGAAALERSLAALDAAQLRALRLRLLEMQGAGAAFAPETWPAKLLRSDQRYLDILESMDAKIQRYYKGREQRELVPRLSPDSRLDAAVQPRARLREPIPDAAVLEAQRLWGAPGLFEHAARARRKVVGAMFPHSVKPR